MRWAAVSIYLWRSRYRGRALQVSFWPLSAVDGVEAGYTLNLTTWEKDNLAQCLGQVSFWPLTAIDGVVVDNFLTTWEITTRGIKTIL